MCTHTSCSSSVPRNAEGQVSQLHLIPTLERRIYSKLYIQKVNIAAKKKKFCVKILWSNGVLSRKSPYLCLCCNPSISVYCFVIQSGRACMLVHVIPTGEPVAALHSYSGLQMITASGKRSALPLVPPHVNDVSSASTVAVVQAVLIHSL